MKTKKSIPKAIIFFMLIIFAKQLMAQTNGNYVSNGDFESYNTCPSVSPTAYNSTIWYSNGWENSNTSVHGGTTPTPDYFNTCDNTGNCSNSLPNNKYGVQNTRLNSTNAYIGICFNSNYREYVTKQLNTTLTANVEYEVTFYVSNSEFYHKVYNNIGALITSSRQTQTGNTKLTATPQILSFSHIYDVSGWTKITGTFVASGGEQWITIGCFGDENGTLVESSQTPTSSSCTVPYIESYETNSYFFIDDVSIIEKPNPNFTYNSGVANCNINTVNGYSSISASWVSHYWVLSNEFGFSQTSTAQNPVFTNVPAGTYQLSHDITSYGVTSNETKTIEVSGSYNRNEFTAATGTTTWTSSSNPLNNNIGATAKIKNSLVIPANARITINNMTIVMGPNGKIIIERGGSLELNNCTLTTNTECSNTMWQGIQVYGNPAYNQTGTNTDPYQGYLRLNSSTIEHAVVAVCSYKSGSAAVKKQYAGGVIKAYSSTFRNNRNHVIMNEYRAPNKGYNKSVFQSNSFISTALLRNTTSYPNQVVLNYVDLTMVEKVKFVNNTFQTNNNLVENNKRGTGILLNSASVSVYNNNNFTGLYNGIKAINTISFRGNYIDNNYFAGCVRSIYLINSIGDLITNNTINSSRNGYFNYRPVGIYMESSKSFIIKNNTLNGSDIDDGAGLAILGSANAGATIKGNSFQEYDQQFHTEENNKLVLVKCNTFNNYNSFNTFAWYINNNSPSNTPAGSLFPAEIGECAQDKLSGNIFGDECNSFRSEMKSGIEFTYNNPFNSNSNDPNDNCAATIVNVNGCLNGLASANCEEEDIDVDDVGTLENGFSNSSEAILKAAFLNKIISVYMADTLNNTSDDLITWLNGNVTENEEVDKYKILQLIYNEQYDDANAAINALSTSSENSAFTNFYSTLANDLYNGLSLDTLSEEMIYEISTIADAENSLSKLAQHLYAIVDTNVANNYNHNPYVDEESGDQPIFNTESGDVKINEEIVASDILLYPNPTSNLLYLEGINTEMEIELVDMFAKVVFRGSINAQTGSLDLSSLSNGMYIVQFKLGNEILKSEKVLIFK